MIRYKNRHSTVKGSKADFLNDTLREVRRFKNKTKARRVNVLTAVYYNYKDFLDRWHASHFAMKYAKGSTQLLVPYFSYIDEITQTYYNMDTRLINRFMRMEQ